MNLPALASLDAGRYVHWGVINVSVTNLAIVATMVVVFVLALLIPFPQPHEHDDDGNRP